MRSAVICDDGSAASDPDTRCVPPFRGEGRHRTSQFATSLRASLPLVIPTFLSPYEPAAHSSSHYTAPFLLVVPPGIFFPSETIAKRHYRALREHQSLVKKKKDICNAQWFQHALVFRSTTTALS